MRVEGLTVAGGEERHLGRLRLALVLEEVREIALADFSEQRLVAYELFAVSEGVGQPTGRMRYTMPPEAGIHARSNCSRS